VLAARIAAHIQAFELMAVGSRTHLWHLDRSAVAKLWRGGSIIRSALLDPLAEACAAKLDVTGLLGHPALAEPLVSASPALREVVAAAARAGVAVPCLASALSWLDGAHTGRLSANLLQAQRDSFGAHGLARTDQPGRFHLDGEED
jgi:6-phosphogluconate dehydrogenase